MFAVRLPQLLNVQPQTRLERLVGIATNWAAMSFSWCLLMLFKWLMYVHAAEAGVTDSLIILQLWWFEKQIGPWFF